MRKVFILILAISTAALLVVACSGSNDDKITGEVMHKLETDSTIPAAAIDVRTRDGIVVLQGDIYGQAVADQAVKLAGSVPGVRRVDSKLTVHAIPKANIAAGQTESQEIVPTANPKDASIESQIEEKFAQDPVLQALNISVTSTDGVATLNGSVNQSSEARRAVNIARSIPDVKQVKSNLKVASTFVVPQG